MEPYIYQLKHNPDGRIIGKTETVSGKSIHWTYSYDKAGRLIEAKLDKRQVCQCQYDKQGRRTQDYFPQSVGRQVRNYRYTTDNRLQSAGNNGYTHDKNGFRMLWKNKGQYTRYEYSPDYRLLKANEEGAGRVFEFSHDNNGQRAAKLLNGQIIETYQWLDLTRMAAFHAGHGVFEFLYHDGERMPYAMHGNDDTAFSLFYDQIGSLRVVADQSGNVIKEILYDPFGGIIKDTNPDFLVPLGFAGGLHDLDLGLVRFGWRDYDTFTGRWTAPDPMGDAGGDDDWYGYCLDDPVNMVDPLGLMGSKPDEPDEPEPYFQNSWEWQANHGACEKCQALDGRIFHGSLNGVPEDPHPNCKCQVVECEYSSKYGEWKKIEDRILGDRIVSYAGLIKVTVLWERMIRITESRERTHWRQCGSRMPAFIGKGKDDTKYHEKQIQAESDGFVTQGVLQTTNPWTREGVRIPVFPSS